MLGCYGSPKLQGVSDAEIHFYFQLKEHIVRLREELDRVREEKNYFQLERDKMQTFKDVTDRNLEETKAKLKKLNKDIEDDEMHHQVEIEVTVLKLHPCGRFVVTK